MDFIQSKSAKNQSDLFQFNPNELEPSFQSKLGLILIKFSIRTNPGLEWFRLIRIENLVRIYSDSFRLNRTELIFNWFESNEFYNVFRIISRWFEMVYKNIFKWFDFVRIESNPKLLPGCPIRKNFSSFFSRTY